MKKLKLLQILALGIGLMLLTGNVWGQQVIGEFPSMDGGFSTQSVGNLTSTTIGNGVERTDWTVQNTRRNKNC
jgi:hypothetical protein